ncbi:hypothetical protein D3C74_323940 [compost metagenome]
MYCLQTPAQLAADDRLTVPVLAAHLHTVLANSPFAHSVLPAAARSAAKPHNPCIVYAAAEGFRFDRAWPNH